MDICVFCSANADIDTEYFSRAAELGRWIAAEGHTLVFGGCNLGLMEHVAQAAHKAGGRTVGVVPTIVEQGGRVSAACDVRVACHDLTDRKAYMLEHSDLFIALPGGVGTLDEVFTVVAAASIGYHSKPVLLYDINGFWQPLVSLIDSMKGAGMIRRGLDSELITVSSLDEIKRFAAR